MGNLFSIIFFLLFSIGIFNGCRESYDPELQTPDIDNAGINHGYNLTPLGCLLYAPWNLDTDDSSGTDILRNTVFELQRDGVLKYWFKTDYLKSPTDTTILSDGNKSFSHSIIGSKTLLKNNWLKNIYTNGSWKANFKDSTIQISFGKNNFSLLPIEGKYITLGSQEMSIKQISVVSKQESGEKNKYPETYFSFSHY